MVGKESVERLWGEEEVKEGVAGTPWLLLSSAGGLGEPARGWGTRPGSRSETWWGQGIQEPYCAGGELSRGPRQAGVSKGVCVYV